MSKLEMKNLSDLEIIESVKKGNETDFAILIDRYKNRAFSLLKRIIKNDFDAEEVLQDCFIKAYKSLDNFRHEAKFSTWFYRIVYNTALTKISGKKRKIENEMSSIEDHFDLEADTNPFDAEKKELSGLLAELIEKLPEKYASVINLFYMDDMTCEEISEVMDISVSNVKVLLYRSRNALKDILLKNNYVEEFL